jgi:hypothetical protein
MPAGEALQVARTIDPSPLAPGLLARRAMFHLDVARAYGQRHDDAAAVATLLEAERIARGVSLPRSHRAQGGGIWPASFAALDEARDAAGNGEHAGMTHNGRREPPSPSLTVSLAQPSRLRTRQSRVR